MSKKLTRTEILRELKDEVQKRSYQIRDIDINEDDRTISFPFSSETESVERYYGIEILDHSGDSMDLTRLKASAALLENHDWRAQRGVILDAFIKDKRGWVKVKFSRNPQGEELWQDVKDGIKTNVSFGYSVREMILEKEENGVPYYRVTSYEPYEVSFVSIPADISVGIGRSYGLPPEEIKVRKSESFTKNEETPQIKTIIIIN